MDHISVNDVEFGEFFSVAECILECLYETFPDEFEGRDNIGGYITLYEPTICETEALVSGAIKSIDDDMAVDYRAFSLEKPMRARKLGKSNSFLAERNPEKKQWGGGFWVEAMPEDDFQSFGIGFSGLPEALDAVLCLCVLVGVGLIGVDRAQSLANDCNKKVSELFANCIKLEVI